MVKVFKPSQAFSKNNLKTIENTREFNYNWVEWASKNLEIVFFDGTTYTIPIKNNLYLVFLQGSVTTQLGIGQIFKNISGASPIRIFSCRNENTATGVKNQSINFYPPIKFVQGDTLTFTGWDRVNGFGFLDPFSS